MKGRRYFVFLVILTIIGLTSCGREAKTDENILAALTVTPGIMENDEQDEPKPAATPTSVPTPTELPDPYTGMKQSRLTGEWIPEEQTELRPFAVMLNNIKTASPQSGIGEADIVYEALTEAGITRLMAVFSEIPADSGAAERLGSVRSARHYFVSIADEYDAIFVHFGETTYAAKKMKALGIDHITGMYGAGVSSFYRDNTIKAPHNAFATLEGINTAVERAEIRTEYEKDYEKHFRFYRENTIPESKEATKVNKLTLGFSNYMSPWFVYSAQEQLYYRYQFDEKHLDYNTGEQLSFQNIIVQFVEEWNIDKNGYQTMDIEEAEGTGYYISDGVMVPITWVKSESRRFMRYYGEDGEELTINPGKTYVAVFPDSRIKYVITE